MSENKPTPGPWSIVPAPDGDDINIAAPYPPGHALAKAHPNGFAVACAWALWDRDGGRDTQVANARLIAAAPDLLAFAEGILIYTIEDDDRLWVRLGTSAATSFKISSPEAALFLCIEAGRKAVVAKATGGRP